MTLVPQELQPLAFAVTARDILNYDNLFCGSFVVHQQAISHVPRKPVFFQYKRKEFLEMSHIFYVVFNFFGKCPSPFDVTDVYHEFVELMTHLSARGYFLIFPKLPIAHRALQPTASRQKWCVLYMPVGKINIQKFSRDFIRLLSRLMRYPDHCFVVSFKRFVSLEG